MNIKTVLSKPLPVVWYRLVQLIRLKVCNKTGFWTKVEPKVSEKVKNFQSTWKQPSLLFCKNFDLYDDSFLTSIKSSIRESSDNILQGNISIFDENYQLKRPFKWNTDWRTNYQWKNKYFKEYSFYEKDKSIEYDVKFPWELSRLSFLISVARDFFLDGKIENLDYIYEILIDWKQKNPIAYSVNWYPMEVSIRSINLIQLREILILSEGTDKIVNLLNEILILHGIFLWKNIEYTDVRGNHYAANLTALLLLGTVFKDFYKEAKQWQLHALLKIEPEFHLQFIDDGVNFEKSIAYHRLVVELYLICFVVMKRLGIELDPKTRITFKNACKFTKDYTKPNLLTPIIGDNDSASVFQNDFLPLNDHSNLLQLASIFLNDMELNTTPNRYASTLEIYGIDSLKALKYHSKDETQFLSYRKGGFVIVKNEMSYFITDVGEVGMKGRGGHGHNDLFAFELMLDGQDFIVDAGCYTYTGDLVLKNKMKSSTYHNILTVDNQEIAPLIGNWGIADIAKPYDLLIDENEENVVITGKHNGYERLSDPVEHQRTFELNKNSFKLDCFDAITCNSKHNISRHLHFSEHVKLEIKKNMVFATLGKIQYAITCDTYSKPSIETYFLSYNYGHKTSAKKISFETRINGTSELSFSIKKQKENE